MLYKYRGWENKYDKSVLKNQELFFPSVKRFNDPFDSNIKINYENLSPNEQYNLILERVKQDFPNLTYFKKRVKAEYLLKESALGDQEKLRENYEKYVKPQVEEEFGILSLAGKKDNLLMWSHYANSHKGYCVGFKKNKLKAFLRKKEEMLHLIPVEYQKKYPNLHPNELSTVEYSIKPLIVKSCDWSYEEEERIIFIKGSDKTFRFDKNIFSEVIIGCQMRKKHKEELKQIVNENFINLPIYQAKLASRDFVLNFEKL